MVSQYNLSQHPFCRYVRQNKANIKLQSNTMQPRLHALSQHHNDKHSKVSRE